MSRTQKWTLWFHKMLENSLVPKRLLASSEISDPWNQFLGLVLCLHAYYDYCEDIKLRSKFYVNKCISPSSENNLRVFYGCATRVFILSEEYLLVMQIFENRMLGRIFGLKMK
jgi:hypothetical protein